MQKFLIFLVALLLAPVDVLSQHRSVIAADLSDDYTLTVGQQLTFNNTTGDTLSTIILNDWNHAYSDKKTPLARRFSDEFVRSFHYARDDERGSTEGVAITDSNQNQLFWKRPEKHPDLIELYLAEKLLPGGSVTLYLSYLVKLPSDRFTNFGYNSKTGEVYLRNWFLAPARYENGKFFRYSNNNLDDIPNADTDFKVTLTVNERAEIVTDLDVLSCDVREGRKFCNLLGENRRDFALYVAAPGRFQSFRNEKVEVLNSIDGRRTENIQKAIVVDRVVNFVADALGDPVQEKITVSQADHDRNPFYGLNQLPSFINVFSDDFIYELRFLKTYTGNYLKAALSLDQRRDAWISNGIQTYVMMKYIEEYYPHLKIAGGLASVKLLGRYHLVNADFNEQHYFLWMLMARKNLDQPVGDPRNTLLRFNEQIAGKAFAGLAFRYLESYLQDETVATSIREFLELSQQRPTSESDFKAILSRNSKADIGWFFYTMIHSRELIDYRFGDVRKEGDSLRVTLRNRTGTEVPIPLYSMRKKQIVGKNWIRGFSADTTITIPRNDADKLVINLRNEAPEFNRRNNYLSLKPFSLGNKPLRFTFFKDVEDPAYNQVLYVPTMFYNLYDGVTPGIRLYNKTLFDKPFFYDINPMYSTNTQSLTGQLSFTVNQYFRDSRLYNARLSATGSYFHYAPDAAYSRLNPTLLLRIRPDDFRDNRKEVIMLREIVVHREPSAFATEDTEDYAVFNARYSNFNQEITGLLGFTGDFQAAAKFGKVSGEVQYRNLFKDNRLLSARLYAGSFLYNRTGTDFYSFGVDRVTDYLFDYNYYGRSESTGLFSQQLILADGGFKSVFDTRFANQWITSVNLGYSIWNWIEAYYDFGLVKNRGMKVESLFDSGIRLNLVPDYFELYFPFYSSNGLEIREARYAERIRFVLTISPNTLISLFTRKWF